VRAVRFIAAAGLAVIVLGVGALTLRRYDYPDLSRYERYRVEPADVEPGALKAAYVGVATLLLSDGRTALMFDGFFSRPSLSTVLFGKVEPDRAVIEESLRRLGVDRLAAVICVHSHYDHCMDSPIVAEITGAELVGSETTAWIARGAGLSEAHIRVVPTPTTIQYGDFTVTLLASRHVPLAWNRSLVGTALDRPLVPPARASDYPEGGSYTVIVEHPDADILVQGSAGFVSGALRGRDVDLVFLGVGALATKDKAYMDAYWRETIETTTPAVIVPIHFEDFTLPVHGMQRSMPRLGDDAAATFKFLESRTGAENGIALKLMPYWLPVGIAQLRH
jgi:L-ascorbate metabolism protein UlaG (beta-lactamase superfamily)